MPHVILKKTFRIKPGAFMPKTEISYSFHGVSMEKAMIGFINAKLANLHYQGKSSAPQFKWDGNIGHFWTLISNDCQKYHEEDIIVAILDVMEELGWTFRFEYDAEAHSIKMGGGSFTSRELYIFSMPLAGPGHFRT